MRFIILPELKVVSDGQRDDGEDHGNEHQPHREPVDNRREEQGEECSENGARGKRHRNRPHQRCSATLQNRRTHSLERVLDPLDAILTGRGQERVAEVQGVVDGETDGHDEVDDADGVESNLADD